MFKFPMIFPLSLSLRPRNISVTNLCQNEGQTDSVKGAT